jgi:penicillin G amidase
MRRGKAVPPRAASAGIAVLLAAAVLLSASCSSIFRSSVPQRDGVLSLAGISAPVEIVRDSYGVPHIRASNDADLYFAQGFVHAQDRLFQMEMERRAARGELAEIFGDQALSADRLFRHLGLAARAPALVASWPHATREIVEAYCAGANAAVASLRAMPVEMRVLGVRPRPFVPEDVAAVGLLKSFGLAQWTEEATLYRASRVLSPEKLAELLPRVPPGSPVMAPGFRVPAAGTVAPPEPGSGGAREGAEPGILVEGLASLRRLGAGPARSGGSNAWAVSGEKSATGRPILAGDPHLLLRSPSLWYENHLVAPGVDVYGVSFPGAPCVVIGHNPDIAWALTNTMLDDADFFVERIDGERVMHRGEWIPMTRRAEAIRVKGRGDEIATVWETPHGPILSELPPGAATALSFRWIGHDGGDVVGAIHRLNRARNREEFLGALSGYPHPAQNVVYADREGTIGAVTAGRIPVRKGGSGLLPVPGDTGEWEWTGTVPFRENPRVWNPPEGFVAVANFPPAGASYPYYVSRLYEPPDRGKRILAMLSERERFTVEDFERMQSDVLLPEAAETVSLAVRTARSREGESREFREAARILSAWDLRVAADSAGAALYEAFYAKMVENTFRDALGADLFEEATRSSRLLWNAMDRAIERGDSHFFENAATGRRETLDEVAARSLRDAMALLRHRLGNAPATWSWGRLHRVTFEHPFGSRRYLRRWFNIGPRPMPGDGRTVLKGEFRHGADFAALVGPSMRHVVPLGDRAAARSVTPPGQSGHFFERHYRDQTDLWLSGKTRPAWTDPSDIEANARARLRLTKKGDVLEKLKTGTFLDP